jgi:hypothetical protein
MRRTFIIAAVAGALALAGCGGSGGNSSGWSATAKANLEQGCVSDGTPGSVCGCVVSYLTAHVSPAEAMSAESRDDTSESWYPGLIAKCG